MTERELYYQLQQEDEMFDYYPDDYFVEDAEVVVTLENGEDFEIILEGEQVFFNDGEFCFYNRNESLWYIQNEINAFEDFEEVEADEIESVVYEKYYELI